MSVIHSSLTVAETFSSIIRNADKWYNKSKFNNPVCLLVYYVKPRITYISCSTTLVYVLMHRCFASPLVSILKCSLTLTLLDGSTR